MRIVDVCPCCSKKHAHLGRDGPDEPKERLGRRASHCRTGGNDGYWLADGAELEGESHYLERIKHLFIRNKYMCKDVMS